MKQLEIIEIAGINCPVTESKRVIEICDMCDFYKGKNHEDGVTTIICVADENER